METQTVLFVITECVSVALALASTLSPRPLGAEALAVVRPVPVQARSSP
jgi:hypothetical protein